jgi:hypothetical protein
MGECKNMKECENVKEKNCGKIQELWNNFERIFSVA